MNDNLLIGMHGNARGDMVSAALINSHHGALELLHAGRTDYPAAIRRTLVQVQENTKSPDPGLRALLDETLGRFLARVAQNLASEAGMEMRDILAIGYDGQETCCAPGKEETMGMRLGSGKLLAKNTGTTAVGNFQHADMQSGGRGKPLSPLFHQHMFYSQDENRAVLSISESAVLTMLPISEAISAVECGPGYGLIDAWAERHLGDHADPRGRWAHKGHCDQHLLQRLLDDPVFSHPVNTSPTGKTLPLKTLDEILAENTIQPVNVQATLNEFAARRVTLSFGDGPAPKRLLVCGSGAENLFLIRCIAALIPDTVVETTSRFGAEPGWVECMSLAWLAEKRLAESCHDTRPLTGANQAVLLGEIHIPPAS